MKTKLIDKLKFLEVITYGNIFLRSGVSSGVYARIKKAYGNPELLGIISPYFYEIVDKNITCVAGTGVGGIPLATAYSIAYQIPLCIVRDEIKKHGMQEPIEGYVPTKKDKVVILDDVYTSGSSLMDTEKILQTTGAEIIQGCVILARNKPDIYFPVKSILNLEDLL
ncbi:MAG: phosphoribosyltransferase family protein [archaeon]